MAERGLYTPGYCLERTEMVMDCEDRSEKVAGSKSGDWQWLERGFIILSGCQGSGTTHAELRY